MTQMRLRRQTLIARPFPMRHDQKFDNIPRGLTSRGVHRTIIKYLLESEDRLDGGKALLDIPCGEGTFMASLRLFFPNALLRGCDLVKPSDIPAEDFCRIDAKQPFTAFPETPFDVICSISGVMEFDNTLQFFTQCRNHLRERGVFVVTNDNVAGIRDRLSYLWFGKPKQYSLFVTRNQPTWKVLSMSNIVRILLDAGFEIHEIRYVPVRWKEWLWFPLALLIYPIQYVHMLRAVYPMPMALRQAMYPFQSLLSRHYVIICEKAAG